MAEADADEAEITLRFMKRVALVSLALPVDFVSGLSGPRSLTLIYTEEICGRFGSFRWINLRISRL